MEIDSTRIILKLPQSLEEKYKDLCDKPYFIERLEKKDSIVWYGYNVNWVFKDGQWYEMDTPCEEPEYEKLYQRLIRKKKTHNFDVRFSLSVVGLLLVYAFYSYVKYLFQ